MTATTATMATKRNPVIVRPRCPWRRLMFCLPSPDRAADPLERQTADVVPVEPYKKRLASDVIIRDKTPVAAVVAVVPVVAHHEIVPLGDLAGKTAIIVNAVLAPGEHAYIVREHRRHRRILGDGMLAPVAALEKALGRHISQPFEVTVGAVRGLRPGHAVDGDLLVAIHHLVARQADQALDEILRRIDRIAEDDDVTPLRRARRDDLLFDDRQADAVRKFVDEDEVADFKCRAHRRTRYLERFGDERTQQEHDQQYRKKTLRIFNPPRFAFANCAPLAEDELVGKRDDAGDGGEQEQDQGKVHRWSLSGCRNAARGRSRREILICRPPAGSRETPPAGSRRCRRLSCASCRLSAFPAACACARYRPRNTWRGRSCATP